MSEPTDEQIVTALEAAGVRFQSFPHALTHKTVWCTAGSQPVDKLCAGVRSLLRADDAKVRHFSGIGCGCHEPDDCTGACPDADGEAEYRSWMDLLWRQRFASLGAPEVRADHIRAVPGGAAFLRVASGVNLPDGAQR